jgi:hypothetical protein
MLKIPKLDSAEIIEVNGVRHRLRCGFRRWNTLRRLGYHAIALAKFHFQCQGLSRRFGMLEEAVHIETGMLAEHRFGLRKNILDKCCRNDAQPDFSVDSSESQIVDLIAKGRDVRPLRRVHIHRQHVFSAEIDVRRQIKGKRGVAALVLAEAHAVDPNGRGGHHPFEVDENAFAARLRWQTKTPPINGHKLILLFVEAVPGQPDIRVRNNDALKRGVIKLPRVHSFDNCAVVTPIPVDGKDQPAIGGGSRSRGIASEQSWGKRTPRNDSARCL